MIFIDPVTRQRVTFQPNSGDFEYDRKGADAVAKETVPVIGPWSDSTGSDLSINSRNLTLNPLPNSFQGQVPGIMGQRLGNLNVVGQDTAFTRRRTKRVCVDSNGRIKD